MPGRTRTRDLRSLTSGSLTIHSTNTVTTRSVTTGLQQHCVDVTGNYPRPNPFGMENKTSSVYFLDGEQIVSGVKQATLSQFPAPQSVPSVPDPVTIYGAFTDVKAQQKAQDMLARSNPSKPAVNVPAFLGELKDIKQTISSIPQILQKSGDSLLRRSAAGNVSWQFGIRPMISDVRKLFAFRDSVDQRLRWLNRLANEKSISRNVPLGDSSEDTGWGKNTYIFSQRGLVRAEERTVYSEKYWGTVKWKLDPGFTIPAAFKEREKIAFKMAFGLSTHGAVAASWELLPWSWFIDWFVDIGDMINATYNTIPLSPADMCVMRHTKATRSYRITEKPAWITVSNTRADFLERKERKYVPFLLLPFTVSLPAITAGQWSILGSLSVLKSSRRVIA